MNNTIKSDIQNILELIEDKQYPAKRILFDYIVSLVGSLDYKLSKEIENMGYRYFNKMDINKGID